MKHAFCLLALIAFMPVESQAKSIFPGKTLKVVSPDQSINLKKLTYELDIRCSFDVTDMSNLPCGHKTKNLTLSDKGIITIPEVNKFLGIFQARKEENYTVTLTVKRNEKSIASFYVKSDYENDFINSKDELNIIDIKETRIDLTLNGEGLFGSEISRNPTAKLNVGAFGLHSIPKRKVNIWSTVEWISIHYKNDNKSLEEAKELIIPATAFAYFGQAEHKLDLGFDLEVDGKRTHATSLAIDPSEVDELRSVDLVTVNSK